MSSEQWKKDNIDKVRQYRREWYYRNKQKQIDRQRESKQATRSWINELKESMSCADCGMSFEGK